MILPEMHILNSNTMKYDLIFELQQSNPKKINHRSVVLTKHIELKVRVHRQECVGDSHTLNDKQECKYQRNIDVTFHVHKILTSLS